MKKPVVIEANPQELAVEARAVLACESRSIVRALAEKAKAGSYLHAKCLMEMAGIGRDEKDDPEEDAAYEALMKRLEELAE
jgi:hypothetical protein